MRPIALLFAGFLIAIAVSLAAAPAQALTLVEDGQPRVALVVPKEAFSAAPAETGKKKRKGDAPVSEEMQAAREIQTHVEKISGAALPIVPAGEDLKGLKPIVLRVDGGTAANGAAVAPGKDPSSFTLVVKSDGAVIAGLSPRAVFHGASELLEQLGVRWFMPGDLGTVIPQTRTLVLKEQATVQAPAFATRYLQGTDDTWGRRLRSGGMRFPSAHGMSLGEKEETLLASHPEYFALRSGQRSKSQLCLSNPEVLNRVIESTRKFFRDNPSAEIIGMGAHDGRGFCECDGCRALDGGDYDPFAHAESMTDRYVWFFNKVLDGIKDEFPDKRIGFYAYASYNRPPVKVKPDPRVVPAVAMITLCRMHGMANPVCPEKGYEAWIIREWGKIVPHVYFRGYWFNLADPGLPFFMVRRIGREVPLGKTLGVDGWRTECITNWAGNTPSLYLAYKLMWDPTTNVDALMADFCEKFFGPAAAPMRRYIDLMDKAVDEADYHAGSIWDMAAVYPAAVRATARACIDEAARLAPADTSYARRVAAYRESLDFLDGFARLMDARTVHDYAGAKQGYDQMVACRDRLLAMTPPLLGKHAKDYMGRYLTDTVVQGFARTTGGNKLLAGLKDEWLFQIDPERVGETLRWQDPAWTGGSWQPIRTSSRTWSDQGLRYYKGLAWYRQTIDLPAEAEGRRVFLWFGAIDDRARVWVNGKDVGISPKVVFKPFELDATEAVRPGKPNVVVVCIGNETLNELGTGGIMGPVMFYLPAAGKDAKLENLKPLGTVFPEY